MGDLLRKKEFSYPLTAPLTAPLTVPEEKRSEVKRSEEIRSEAKRNEATGIIILITGELLKSSPSRIPVKA